MKKALLFFLFAFCIFFTYTNRYQPISLELASPALKRVEIKGEVQNPGTYRMKWDATLDDLIQEAGGLLDTADPSSLSLIQNVDPDSTIFIPSAKQTEQQISINTASKEELCRLKGVGPSLAQRIIDYRSQKPFSSLEEIMQVKGIGEKLFAKFKEQIRL